MVIRKSLNLQVKHSFSINKDAVLCWLVVSKNGIDTSHYTCVAGIGECCSHLASICFYVEFLYSKKENVACTEELPYWMQPGYYKF